MLTRNRRKEIASLHRKKGRDRLGAFLVEGVRSVESALQCGAALREIVVTEEARRSARLAAWLDTASAPVSVVPEAVFGGLSDVRTSQGVLAVAAMPDAPADLNSARTILALDGVQDPGNVGTLLRTAAWFGIDAVLAGSGTADFYNPKVVRATMGGLWDLRLAAVGPLADELETLRAAGFFCYGADLGGTPLAQWAPRRPSILVMGSEAHGPTSAVRSRLDERIEISPTTKADGGRGVESLNVAVAGGILMHRWAVAGVAS